MRFVPSLVLAGVALSIAGLAGAGFSEESGGDRPSIVVTTNILADIVAEVVGEEADVDVIMPLGADPHDFAPSAREAESMEQADLLVVNGAGFEEGLLGVIESAEESGAEVFAFADHVDLLVFTGEHEDGEHDDEDGERDDGEHGDGSVDPHIWTDPSRMATAVAAFAERVAEVEGVDVATIETQAETYIEELVAIDAEIEDVLADVPPERRVLVTNHEVLGYFADRYGFEVIGAVVPSLTTNASSSAADVEALAELIDERDVPAIFAETTQPTQLAVAIADETGRDVEVIELFTESLGEDGSGAETYVGMMRVNAQRIAGALS